MMTAEGFETTLAAARAGAEWAFAALYRAHQPRLLRYLGAHHPTDAEDIASEAWLDAARSIGAFAGSEDAFRGWLFTIARRRLIDHRRHHARRPAVPSGDDAVLTTEAESAEADAFAGALGDDAARQIVSALHPDQAEIVLLRVVAGLTVEQVAEVTGRRAGTVRVIQHRALDRLAKSFSAEM